MSAWTVNEQKETTATVSFLWTAFVMAHFGLPRDTTFMLFRFPVLLHPFLGAMSLFWGAFLFYMVLSHLPIGKKNQLLFRDHALLWLVVMPAVFGLVITLVAADVSYPFLDPLVLPLFLMGFCGTMTWYLNYVTDGRFNRGMKRAAPKVAKLARERATSAERFIY